jgi:hypothetical protein
VTRNPLKRIYEETSMVPHDVTERLGLELAAIVRMTTLAMFEDGNIMTDVIQDILTA